MLGTLKSNTTRSSRLGVVTSVQSPLDAFTTKILDEIYLTTTVIVCLYTLTYSTLFNVPANLTNLIAQTVLMILIHSDLYALCDSLDLRIQPSDNKPRCCSVLKHDVP